MSQGSWTIVNDLIVNDLTIAAIVLELVQEQPELPDDLRRLTETALARLTTAADRLRGVPTPAPVKHLDALDQVPREEWLQ